MQLSGSQTRKRLGKVGLRHTLIRVLASFLCDYLDSALLNRLGSQADSLHSSKRAASRASEFFSARRHCIEYTRSKKCREPFNVVVWLPVALRPHAYLFTSRGQKLIFLHSHWTKFLSFTPIGSYQDMPLSLNQSWWQRKWDNTDWLRLFRSHPWDWPWDLNVCRVPLCGRGREKMLKWQL